MPQLTVTISESHLQDSHSPDIRDKMLKITVIELALYISKDVSKGKVLRESSETLLSPFLSSSFNTLLRQTFFFFLSLLARDVVDPK